MKKLLVKLLDSRAKAPTVAHAGEDLGFDVYALEDTFLKPHKPVLVHTGIAAIYVEVDPVTVALGYQDPPPGHIGFSGGWYNNSRKFGLEVRDRSSMAAKHGIQTMAGIIDAGYRGEIGVVMELTGPPKHLRPETLASLRNAAHMESGLRADYIARVNRLNPPSGWTEQFLTALNACDAELVRYWQQKEESGYQIKAGDKIAQLLPREVMTTDVAIVEDLPGSARGDRGFGSSGK